MFEFSHFGCGYLTCNGLIDKVSIKSNSMSVGLVLLEEKMFKQTFSLAKCQNIYYSVRITDKALKVCDDTEHQKVAEQHIY